MIKLIVGLGNPGQKYEKTRHNVGFLFLDRFVLASGWVFDNKFEGLVAECCISGCKLVLLKPNTYMNCSGQSVGKVARYFKFNPENVLVVHDELDFDVGVVRLKKGGGHAGHNGLRDIIAHLDSGDFYRLRIGIGRPVSGKSVAGYVLSEPSKNDSDRLLAAMDIGQKNIGQMVNGDILSVMASLNNS